MKVLRNHFLVMIMFCVTIISYAQTETAKPSSDRDVFLMAEISNMSISPNSETEVIYKLYVSHEVGITSWKLISKPEFTGFVAEEVDVTPLKVSKDSYKGKSYRSVVIAKHKLMSSEKGTHKLDPMTMNVVLNVAKKTSDDNKPFDLVNEERLITSQPISIEVK